MKFNNNLQQTTKNYEGGEMLQIKPEVELLKLSLTYKVEDRFYDSIDDVLKNIKTYASKVDPEFLVRLAIYGRQEGLRTINQVLLAIYIHLSKGKIGLSNILKRVIYKMFFRPDELGELIAIYTKLYNNKDSKNIYLPRALQRAIKEIIESDKFNDYQYSKYKNKGDLKLHDIVNLVHAKGPNADMIINNKYIEINTFEKVSSKLGKGEERKNSMLKMLKKGEIGDKALLGYLANMIEDGIDLDFLINEINKREFNAIFPYEIVKPLYFAYKRFLNADTNREKLKNFIDALSKKAVQSFGNLNLKGKTAILIDTSGSMASMVSGKSVMSCIDLASIYGGIVGLNNGIIYAWATNTKEVKVLPGDNILRIVESIKETYVGYGTNLQQAIDHVKDEYDNVIVFTDMQIMDSINNTGNLNNIFVFDLIGYNNGAIETKGNKIISFTGFNDKMFQLGASLLKPQKIIEEIMKIEF